MDLAADPTVHAVWTVAVVSPVDRVASVFGDRLLELEVTEVARAKADRMLLLVVRDRCYPASADRLSVMAGRQLVGAVHPDREASAETQRGRLERSGARCLWLQHLSRPIAVIPESLCSA